MGNAPLASCASCTGACGEGRHLWDGKGRHTCGCRCGLINEPQFLVERWVQDSNRRPF